MNIHKTILNMFYNNKLMTDYKGLNRNDFYAMDSDTGEMFVLDYDRNDFVEFWTNFKAWLDENPINIKFLIKVRPDDSYMQYHNLEKYDYHVMTIRAKVDDTVGWMAQKLLANNNLAIFKNGLEFAIKVLDSLGFSYKTEIFDDALEEEFGK